MYRQIAKNKKNTIILMLTFILMLSVIGFAFTYLFSDWKITAWMMSFAIVYAIFQYFFANSILLKMTNANPLERRELPRLYNIVENLAISENLPMPKIYIIEDSSPNAFASGRDPKNAVITVTTGLLDIMNDNELRGVVAHEMSHIKNYDIRISMLVFGLTSVIGILSDIGLRIAVNSDEDTVSPIGFGLSLLVAIFMPLIATLSRLAISREREYLADASAAKMLGGAEDMIAALKKLQTHGSPMKKQYTAMSQMFINNPEKNFFNKLFSTHPPLENRIQKLEETKSAF